MRAPRSASRSPPRPTSVRRSVASSGRRRSWCSSGRRSSGAPGDPDAALRGIDEGIARLGPAYSLVHAAIELEVERESWAGALARSEPLPEALRERPEWQARRSAWRLALGREAEARR